MAGRKAASDTPDVEALRAGPVAWNTYRASQGPDYRPDFNGKDLSGLQCGNDITPSNPDGIGADLSRANFGGASLEGACLRGANCNRAFLEGIQGHGSDWRDADCAKASFYRASLSGAQLDGMILQGTGLLAINCTDASCVGTDFTGVRTTDGADFKGADLTGAIIPPGTNFTGADLRFAKYDPEVIAEASTKGAKFSEDNGAGVPDGPSGAEMRAQMEKIPSGIDAHLRNGPDAPPAPKTPMMGRVSGLAGTAVGAVRDWWTGGLPPLRDSGTEIRRAEALNRQADASIREADVVLRRVDEQLRKSSNPADGQPTQKQSADTSQVNNPAATGVAKVEGFVEGASATAGAAREAGPDVAARREVTGVSEGAQSAGPAQDATGFGMPGTARSAGTEKDSKAVDK